jgi:cell division septation protein DedD
MSPSFDAMASEIPRHGRERRPRREQGGTLIGMFIGLILGLTLAAGIAYYLSKGGALSRSLPPSKDPAKSVAKAQASSGRGRFDFYDILPGGEVPRIRPPETRPLEGADTPGKGEIPKAETARADAARVEPVRAAPATGAPPGLTTAAVEAPSADVRRGRSYLQAGAFQKESDAENQKARLALSGWEATIQAATLPDRTTWYRVRVGPFDNVDEMNRNRAEMAKRGFDVSVIRNP